MKPKGPFLCQIDSTKRMVSPVVLEYEKLVDPNCDLNDYIAEAFGNNPNCLGLCFVKGVPGLLEKREKLLRLASSLAALPKEELDGLEHPESTYSFGWSHGKEIMNGKPDFAKGSFYNNPIYNIPPSNNPEYAKEFPAYGCPNVWPKSLPELEVAFMDLGKLIVQVGQLVAIHCDKYLKTAFQDLPPEFLQSMIRDSITHKARLLHYFPISQKDAEPTPDGGNMDSWCGLHLDHSVLTGLTSAMYFDESDSSFPEIDKSNSKVAQVLQDAGLYIKNKRDEFTQV
jgi:isopenicillin N synthase-like dioxygenase